MSRKKAEFLAIKISQGSIIDRGKGETTPQMVVNYMIENKLFVYNEVITYENNSIKIFLDRDGYKKYGNCKIYCFSDNNFYFVKRECLNSIECYNLIVYEPVIKNFLKPLPYVNTVENIDFDEMNAEYRWYKFIHYHTQAYQYFEEGTSENINYKNKKQLKFIQDSIREQYNKGYKQPHIREIPLGEYSSSLDVEWWLFRGWSEKEAKQKISATQTERSLKLQAKRKEDPERYKNCLTTSINYYLNKGYSEEEAAQMLHDRQNTTSLESFIRRYGEEEGTIRFNNRNSKWQNTLQNKEDYIEMIAKRINFKSASKISQEMFDNIRERLLENGCDIQVYYWSLNHEYGFGAKGWGGFLYDFVIPELKYAIEYNGEKFHPDPRLYPTEKLQKLWTNPWGKSYDECFEKDTIKNQVIRDKGFDLDIVWEREYKADKLGIVKQIVDKILKLYEEYKLKNNPKV